MNTAATVVTSPGARSVVPVPAKTAVPRLRPGHLSRPRLLALLDAAGADDVVLVVAPAGYGRTRMLAEWAGTAPGCTAWVTLDADVDDLSFWSLVLASLSSCAAVPADSALRRMRVPTAGSADADFLADVQDALDALPEPVRLVLDDVHELTAPGALSGLGFLVRNRSPAVRLALSARTEPPLPVARMRLAGELCEIRGAELRFTPQEAEDLLRLHRLRLSPDQVRRLVAQTAGWAAGLSLAALSLRDADDVDGALSELAATSTALSEYLVGEVLSAMAPEVRALLRAVSVCDRVPVGLAVALSGRDDAGDLLHGLEEGGELVHGSPARGPGGDEVRYAVHPLLREHLRAGLRRERPDLLAELHRRAADWFAARSRTVHALHHARLAGDRDRGAALLREHGVALVAGGRLAAVRAAAAWLTGGAAGDPWSSLVAALAALEAGAWGEAEEHLRRAGSAPPAGPDAELAALAGLVRTRHDVLLAADLDRAAQPAVSGSDGRGGLAALADLDRALALVTAGRPGDARALAETTLEEARRHAHGYVAARSLAVLAAVATKEGDYRRMTALAERADAELPAAEWRSSAGAGLTSVLRAQGALLRSRPEQCLALLEPPVGADGRSADSLQSLREGLRAAALVDLGDVEAGMEAFSTARATAVTPPGGSTPELMATVAVLEHGAALTLGRHDRARAVAVRAEQEFGPTADVLLLHARRLAASGHHSAALDLLGPGSSGASRCLPWTLVEEWVLRCRLRLLTGRRPQAHDDLLTALALAGAMDAVRPLVGAPPEVVDLLARRLGGFGDLEAVAGDVLRLRAARGTGPAAVHLTGRELDVLGLLSTSRSLDEIAADLAVSHSTVKTHVKAIYAKLDAGSRRAAVTAARRRGLLLPEPP